MVLQSMTGFGRGDVESEYGSYSCEIKTLNSRFIDVNVRIPKPYIGIETSIIHKIKDSLARGKIDIVFEIRATTGEASLPQLDLDHAKHYLELERTLQSLGTCQSMTSAELLNLPGVLSSPSRKGPSDADQHKEGILGAIELALTRVLATRQKEGEQLRGALDSLIAELDHQQKALFDKTDDHQKLLVERSKERISNLVAKSDTISEDRLATEICIIADRTDISEEVTRLKAHSQEFRTLVNQGGTIGRKLDFLCQELHREINTVSNKMTGLDVSGHSIEIKQIVEKIRQQVQNIE